MLSNSSQRNSCELPLDVRPAEGQIGHVDAMLPIMGNLACLRAKGREKDQAKLPGERANRAVENLLPLIVVLEHVAGEHPPRDLGTDFDLKVDRTDPAAGIMRARSWRILLK